MRYTSDRRMFVPIAADKGITYQIVQVMWGVGGAVGFIVACVFNANSRGMVTDSSSMTILTDGER